ncbi:MAG: hypothetical protein ACM3YM_03865 [Sphingomonadales bacterium]
MRDSTGQNIRAGGCLLSSSILICTIAGVLLRQSSIGFLVGAAIGLALLALLWLKDRR